MNRSTPIKNLEKKWVEFYPGINLNRLNREFETYLDRCKFNNPYISHRFCLDAFTHELNTGKPFEYINQLSFFFNSNFYINENVLIPRNETELLVEWAIEYLNGKKNEQVSVLDLGVGSGAILLSILRAISHKKITAIGSDISQEALLVFQLNCMRLKNALSSKHLIKHIKSDRFESINGRFDLIITNPPYIMDDELAHEKVHQFEPHQALYLKRKTYFKWFDDLFKSIPVFLKPDGMLMMEGDHRYLDKLKVNLEKLNIFQDVQLRFDYAQKLRYLLAKGLLSG